MNSSPSPESEAIESLMQRSLEGRLAPEEGVRLEKALKGSPETAAEYESLKSDLKFWENVVVPAVSGPAIAPGEACPVPESVLETLRAAAAATWQERKEREAAGKIVSLPAPASAPSAPSAPSSSGPRALRPAVWLALAAAVAAALVVLPRILPKAGVSVADVELLAPDPSAPSPFADPVFVWESGDESGQRYDVWILPEGGDQLESEALYLAEDVVSPLPLRAMRRGGTLATALPQGGYQVLICLAGQGRLSGVPRPFAIAEDAASIPNLASATPGELQLALQDLLARSPEGALMAIAALPEAMRSLPEVDLLERAARERIAEK